MPPPGRLFSGGGSSRRRADAPNQSGNDVKIILASPRGFCAGVDRAIEIVERALSRSHQPVYVRHEIVHNRHVVEGLRKKGAIFVDDPEEAPPGAEMIYSAHG
ncbi:MAG: hypothetical protein CBC48_13510, partial [bacterium TMED88]